LGRYVGGTLVVLSLALASVASAFLLLGPTGTEEKAEEAVPEGARPVDPVSETHSTTLLGQIQSGEEDALLLVWLVVPIAVAVVPIALARTRFYLVARSLAAAVLLAFSFVAAASIGLFYLPSALSMVAAAIVGSSRRPEAA
jgi:hypothetical protein